HEISIGASVGIAFARARRKKQPSELVREADAAMYRAKRHGTGIELFETVIRADALRELETEHQLRGALERAELRLHYQPEVELKPGGHPFGVEALVRWEHPARGLLMPSEFVGLAEDTGLIVPIGEWVLAEACRQLAMWRRQGLVPEDFTVSVNLSHRQLSSSRLPAVVAAALERSQVPAQCLCLEATESCVAHDGR